VSRTTRLTKTAITVMLYEFYLKGKVECIYLSHFL